MLSGTVRSDQAGTFEVSFAVPFNGAYSVDINYGNNPNGPWEPIKDSPFQVGCRRCPFPFALRAHTPRRSR